MQSSEFNDLDSSKSNILYIQSTLSDPQSPPQGATSPVSTHEAALVMIPIGFVAIWAAVVCAISNTWKINRKEIESKQHTAQLPCKRCRFFNNNPYVKCAVNPHTAMTKAATECGDYQLRERRDSR